MLGAGFRQIVIEVAVDNWWLRCAFILLTPVQVFFTLFFTQVIIGCLAQCVGPIRQMQENSRFYCAIRPRRIKGRQLPYATIQYPVYRKIIDEEERQARVDFDTDHSMGWTARPKHGSEGFVRKGKFKKASNMELCLMLSCNSEEKPSHIHRHASWNQSDEVREYERCLTKVIEGHGRAWAHGNIRIGDYILIIDSDTRMPADCLLDAVSEMEQSPEVGVMQVVNTLRMVSHLRLYIHCGTDGCTGITFFTNLIYTAIRYTVSNGDVASFVGHNANLRWSAIQSIGYEDEDGYEKFRSEAHVSEDFEMSLK